MSILTKSVNIKTLIDWRVMLMSFLVGMIYICIVDEAKQVLFVYPNVDTTQKVLYQDFLETCYKLNLREVSCYENESKIVDVDNKIKMQSSKESKKEDNSPFNIYSLLFDNE